MSTLWTLIEVCFRDARKAEDLLADPASRRELRLDTGNALAGFVLGSPLRSDARSAGVRGRKWSNARVKARASRA